MADLLPSTSDATGPGNDDPRVIGVDSDAADDLLSALSSRTARRILTELHADPATPAALADRVDTSLQNAQYHLEKLEAAGLIEVADTVYSEKGREMRVYVPADRALVVVAGREEDTSGLKATLRRLLGGVGVLGAASLVVDRALGGPTARLFTAGTGGGSESGGADGGADPTGGSGGGSAGGGSGDSGDASTGAPDYQVSTDDPVAPETTGGDGTVTESAEATSTAADGATGTQTPTPEATRFATEEATSATAQTTSTPVPDTDAAWTATETAVSSADPTLFDTLSTSPGLLFFLGGLTVLLVGLVVYSAGK